jgi:hypothetical protein
MVNKNGGGNYYKCIFCGANHPKGILCPNLLNLISALSALKGKE